MNYYIQTYGCQMNYSDSERVTTVLRKMKYKPAKGFQDADLIILNTCSVKQKAHDRIYGLGEQFIPLKEKNPNLRIGITGCMVRETGVRGVSRDETLRRMGTVDFVFKIKELMRLPEILHTLHRVKGADEMTDMLSYFHISPTITNLAQVFIPIMSGCNNYCSYCIVPYTRGKEISRDMGEIMDEVKKMAKRGALEVNLVGQNVNSYNPKDADPKSSDSPFTQLLRKIDRIKGIDRIRFYTVHPKDMGEDVIALYGTLRSMVPHIHLPLQSGCDTVLKRMNRRYDTAKYTELVKKLRKQLPGISITTDVIVGFCGETEKEFKTTCKFVRDLRLDSAFISKYSARKGTLADRTMKDDIPLAVKKDRERQLTDIFEKNSYEYNQRFAKKTVQVLVEKVEKGWATGKIPEFKPCRFPASDIGLIGKCVKVRVKKAMEWALEGTPV
ncbi:MAG: tRNA (N6-isopentenyl adenosine(37)-C2)-methylthiotransferase MiaB [Candidatus Peregrinibacteria bacterium]